MPSMTHSLPKIFNRKAILSGLVFFLFCAGCGTYQVPSAYQHAQLGNEQDLYLCNLQQPKPAHNVSNSKLPGQVSFLGPTSPDKSTLWNWRCSVSAWSEGGVPADYFKKEAIKEHHGCLCDLPWMELSTRWGNWELSKIYRPHKIDAHTFWKFSTLFCFCCLAFSN